LVNWDIIHRDVIAIQCLAAGETQKDRRQQTERPMAKNDTQ
jgi:hypothetical protein